MSTTRTTLHLSCCDCPHVNIVVAEHGQVKGHFACGADEAERIANELLELAKAAREKIAARLNIGHA